MTNEIQIKLKQTSNQSYPKNQLNQTWTQANLKQNSNNTQLKIKFNSN